LPSWHGFASTRKKFFGWSIRNGSWLWLKTWLRNARRFYQLAQQALPEADRRSMVAAELMGSVLLATSAEARGPEVQRVWPDADSAEQGAKVVSHFQSLVSIRLRAMSPSYGV
jgi:hypothetical protein